MTSQTFQEQYQTIIADLTSRIAFSTLADRLVGARRGQARRTCPLCKHTGSFRETAHSGHCFHCDQTLTIFSLWQHVHGGSFADAVKRLAEQEQLALPTWRSTPEEQAQRTRLAEEAKARAEQDRAAQVKTQAAARETCEYIWSRAAICRTHPYLQRKGVDGYGLKVWRESLVIPFYTVDGALSTLQFITPDGQKYFKGGAVKQGAYHLINPRRAPLTQVAAVEGYATGAEIYKAFGLPVIVCADAGNVPPVLTAFLKASPHSRITFYADNDAFKKENKGKDTALRLINHFPQIDAKLPTFKNTESKPTDFNDLAILEGIDAVRQYAPDSEFGSLRPTRFLTYTKYLAEVLDLYDMDNGHYLLTANTGSGKTTMIARAARKLREDGIQAVLSTPTTLNAEQFALTLQGDFHLIDGEDFVHVAAGRAWPRNFRGLIITTYSGVRRKRPATYCPAVVLIDEVQKMADADYMQAEVDAVLDMASEASMVLGMTATPYIWQLDDFDRRIHAVKRGETPTAVRLLYYPKGKQAEVDLALDASRGTTQQAIIVRDSCAANAVSVEYRQQRGQTAQAMDAHEKGKGSPFDYLASRRRTPNVDAFYTTSLYETGLSLENTNISHLLMLPNEKHDTECVTPHSVKQTANRTRKQTPPIYVALPDYQKNTDDAPFDYLARKHYYQQRQAELKDLAEKWFTEGTFNQKLFDFHQKDLLPVRLVYADERSQTVRNSRSGVNMCVTAEYRQHLAKYGAFREREFNQHGLTLLASEPFAAPETSAVDAETLSAAKMTVRAAQQTAFEAEVNRLAAMDAESLEREAKYSKLAQKYYQLLLQFPIGSDAAALLLACGQDDKPFDALQKHIRGAAILPDLPGMEQFLRSLVCQPKDGKKLVKAVDRPSTKQVARHLQILMYQWTGKHGELARLRLRRTRNGDAYLPQKGMLTLIRNFITAAIVHTADGSHLRVTPADLAPVKTFYEDATGKAFTPESCPMYFARAQAIDEQPESAPVF